MSRGSSPPPDPANARGRTAPRARASERAASSARPYRLLQVEVTSRCTRACVTCPQSVLGGRWRHGDLTEPSWRAIEPALRLFRQVQLNGWGEPLLHPGVELMARGAKRAGCTVSFTTNADLLDQADWVAETVDLVTIPVAGAAANHGMLRDGSRLDEVLASAARLARPGGRLRRRPVVELRYLLTRDNARDLEHLVGMAAAAGLRRINVAHLECTPADGLLQRSALWPEGLAPGIAEHLAAALAAARRARVTLRLPAMAAAETVVCSFDPTTYAFVSWDGRVGPCPYLLLPVEGAIGRHTWRGAHAVEAASFGRIGGAMGLAEVLSGSARSAFIAPLQQRSEAERSFAGRLAGTSRRAVAVERAQRARRAVFEANPFPPSCEGCHKAQGW